MEHLEGSFSSAGGAKLYYQRWVPDGQMSAALAIVHGLGEHSGRYGNLVSYFVPRGYGLWAFDLRGHGRTPGLKGHLDDWSEIRADVGRFLDLIREQEPSVPVFLFGHSLGGLAVLDFSIDLTEGVRGIVASAPALDTSGLSAAKVAIARMLSSIWPKLRLATGLDVSGLSRDQAVVDAYVNDPLVHDKASARFGGESIKAISRTLDNAGRVALPLLVIKGAADWVVPIASTEVFFERVGSLDKTFIKYEDGYHEPHNDIEKEQVFTDVLAWLEQRR